MFEQAKKDLIRCGQIETNAAADKLLLEIKDKVGNNEILKMTNNFRRTRR